MALVFFGSLISFVVCEVYLVSQIAFYSASTDDKELFGVLVVRLLFTFALAFSTSWLAVKLAERRRLKKIQTDWLRSESVRDSLSTYVLTLFDHLIGFYYLARIRCFTDAIIIISLLITLHNLMSFDGIFAFGGLASLVVLALVALYKVLSKIAVKTTAAEKAFVECTHLLNERGALGWKEEDLNTLFDKVVQLSNRLGIFYTVRMSISQLMRTMLEFFVFVLVASGILVATGQISVINDGNTGGAVAAILVASRLGPLLFSLVTMSSTLGLGSYANQVYTLGTRK